MGVMMSSQERAFTQKFLPTFVRWKDLHQCSYNPITLQGNNWVWIKPMHEILTTVGVCQWCSHALLNARSKLWNSLGELLFKELRAALYYLRNLEACSFTVNFLLENRPMKTILICLLTIFISHLSGPRQL